MRLTAPRHSADHLWKNRLCKVPREFRKTGSSPVLRPFELPAWNSHFTSSLSPATRGQSIFFRAKHRIYMCSFASSVASSHRSRTQRSPCQAFVFNLRL